MISGISMAREDRQGHRRAQDQPQGPAEGAGELLPVVLVAREDGDHDPGEGVGEGAGGKLGEDVGAVVEPQGAGVEQVAHHQAVEVEQEGLQHGRPPRSTHRSLSMNPRLCRGRSGESRRGKGRAPAPEQGAVEGRSRRCRRWSG